VTFTQRETFHMMGEKFSTMSFDIFAYGKPTNIKRVIHTTGSPKFETTLDQFACGDEIWERGKNPQKVLDWLTEHAVEKSQSEQSAIQNEAKT